MGSRQPFGKVAAKRVQPVGETGRQARNVAFVGKVEHGCRGAGGGSSITPVRVVHQRAMSWATAGVVFSISCSFIICTQ